MAIVGSSREWANLIDSMVPKILKLVVATWEEMPLLDPDDTEDNITVALSRALRRNREVRGLPFQIHTQMVELEPMQGEDLGRMDIVFIPINVTRESIYFCLESKRLNVFKNGKTRSYASEYVRFGMLRFVTGRYSREVRHGGMIAYVFDGKVPLAITNIEANIRRQRTALCMTASGAFLPSTVLKDEARARETHHHRLHEATFFRIHHLFMATHRTRQGQS